MKRVKQRKLQYVTCHGTGTPHRVKRIYTARQHTYYPDDSANFFTGCKECHAENDARIAEMWREYWYSQGVL
jgi:hypothetical protein